MTLGDKLRSLRSIEGSLRGFGRPLTQSEVATAMKKEIGRGLRQAYLSQIENGARPHMTNTSRELLARFFRVYPGFLVDDPPGYSRELQSELRMADATVDSSINPVSPSAMPPVRNRHEAPAPRSGRPDRLNTLSGTRRGTGVAAPPLGASEAW